MNSNANHHADCEIGDDLEIIKTTRRAAGAGTWAIGTTNGHRFDALVFPQHAEIPEYELDDSRISKLWIIDADGRSTRRWPTPSKKPARRA